MTAFANPPARVFALMDALRSLPDRAYLTSVLVYHAAPTILGIKPATMVCPGDQSRDLGPVRGCVARDLRVTFGVRMVYFRNRSGSLLSMVYQPALIDTVFSGVRVREFLGRLGYVGHGSSASILKAMTRRCASDAFPHEIGLALGYPLEDVEGFMGGSHRFHACTGCWKGYSDPEYVQNLSGAFRAAKLWAAGLIIQGASLTELARAFSSAA